MVDEKGRIFVFFRTNRLYVLKAEYEAEDTYVRETPEQMRYSDEKRGLPIYEVHELLLNEYGSVQLEKALEFTPGKLFNNKKQPLRDCSLEIALYA